jgi:hypothetical protein
MHANRLVFCGNCCHLNACPGGGQPAASATWSAIVSNLVSMCCVRRNGAKAPSDGFWQGFHSNSTCAAVPRSGVPCCTTSAAQRSTATALGRASTATPSPAAASATSRRVRTRASQVACCGRLLLFFHHLCSGHAVGHCTASGATRPLPLQAVINAAATKLRCWLLNCSLCTAPVIMPTFQYATSYYAAGQCVTSYNAALQYVTSYYAPLQFMPLCNMLCDVAMLLYKLCCYVMDVASCRCP